VSLLCGGVEVESGSRCGAVEVVEREEQSHELLFPGLRRDVQRHLPGVRLSGGERRGGAGRLGVGQERAHGSRVGGSDGGEERLMGERREIHGVAGPALLCCSFSVRFFGSFLFFSVVLSLSAAVYNIQVSKS
jgi:hypothetical protein